MARPARKLHLECRDGSLRVTVKVPADCRAIIGKANLIHTFGKIPYSKAAALHDEIYEGFLEQIINARTGTRNPDDAQFSPRYYPPPAPWSPFSPPCKYPPPENGGKWGGQAETIHLYKPVVVIEILE